MVLVVEEGVWRDVEGECRGVVRGFWAPEQCVLSV
jgi:hypothetical protein